MVLGGAPRCGSTDAEGGMGEEVPGGCGALAGCGLCERGRQGQNEGSDLVWMGTPDSCPVSEYESPSSYIFLGGRGESPQMRGRELRLKANIRV